jgi:outer membrane receptor for monomeric catechols
MGQMYDIPGRDHISNDRYGVSPSLMWKPNESTRVTLSHIYQHDHNIPDYGIPFLSPAWNFPRVVAPVPRGNWYGILGTSLHHVTAITRGSRIASFFWVQSMIRDVTQRNLLFDPDTAITRLGQDHPDHPSVVELTSVYHNLLRQWTEL